jgi:hypothetical protein
MYNLFFFCNISEDRFLLSSTIILSVLFIELVLMLEEVKELVAKELFLIIITLIYMYKCKSI